jgi:hypothetical protein
VETTYCAITTSKELSGKVEIAGVHHGELLDMGQAHLADAGTRLFQHGFGDVDSDDPVLRRIVPERDAGADPDLQNTPADSFGCLDRGLAAAVEDRAEHDVVDRSPFVIGARDHVVGELVLSLHVSPIANRVGGRGVTPVAPRRFPSSGARTHAADACCAPARTSALGCSVESIL